MFCSVIEFSIDMTFDPAANKPNTTLCKINAWRVSIQHAIDLCVWHLYLQGLALQYTQFAANALTTFDFNNLAYWLVSGKVFITLFFFSKR